MRIIVFGLDGFGGAVLVGVGLGQPGLTLWCCRNSCFLGFAVVATSSVEGEGVIAVASDEEGVGRRARWVVARTNRLGC